MPDQADVFNSNTGVPSQPPSAQTPDVFADQLSSIKNEHGQQKYSSVEEALKGLAHAQGYIPELKAKVDAQDEIIRKLQEDLGKRAALEDLVSRVAKPQEPKPSEGQPPQNSGLDETKIVDLVKQVLQQTASESQASANYSKVQETLVSKYGEKTLEVLEAKAKELGTTRKQLGELAKQNPNLVLSLFQTSVSAGPKPNTSSVNIPPINTQPNESLKRPDKSLLAGATAKEQAEFMRRIKEDVYRKYNIET